MAMLPSRTKYRKKQRGSIKGLSKAGNFVDFGEYGMQVLERGWIKANQIEACRVAINRYFSRRGKVWIRVFPDKPITSTPAETRMGKGKGSVDHWVAAVKPGKVLFEVSGVPREVAQAALRRAAAKLALRTRFVERLEQV
ncbi:MAG: 50S ribosomal protein L16 [Chlamydiales bacterium]|jgi:large subunit ribosomal protein L16|nr:50S ribosomal protein L16 [Chlamydiales bacterium]